MSDLRTLKITVEEFIADLRNNVFVDDGDIMLMEFFFKKMDPHDLMEHMIAHVLPHKKKIDKRKINFFMDNKNEIFFGLEEEKIEKFARIIVHDTSEENLDIIWMYFDSMIDCIEKFKKIK